MDDAAAGGSPARHLNAASVYQNNSNHDGLKRVKKVRSACERCRDRRIRCDGQTPACGNCAKAGSACIDVDALNDERRVPRGFAENAVARIAWLEDVIRTQLPHFDFHEDPFASNTLSASASVAAWTDGRSGFASIPLDGSLPTFPNAGSQRPGTDTKVEPVPTKSTSTPPIASQAYGLKRQLPGALPQPQLESSLEQDTRSVALSLGFLSLNSDSRQTHYLGSSSGSLLASLVQTGQARTDISNARTNTASSTISEYCADSRNQDSIEPSRVQFDILKRSCNDLFSQLYKDLPLREECDRLCDKYFSLLHPNHPFIHRQTFNSMIDGLYACAAAERPILLQPNGWPEHVRPFFYHGEEHTSRGQQVIAVPAHIAAFQLLMVLSIGAILQIRERSYRHDPETFFNSAMSISEYVFKSVSLPSLQAILVLLVRSLVAPGGSDIWTMSRLAMAHAVDLGIHREIGGKLKLSNVAVEMRRRIFYCVYSFDSISDGFFDVKLPSDNIVAEHPSMENQSPVPPRDEFINYSIHLFKMSLIVSKIKTLFYRLSEPADNTPWAIDPHTAQSQIRDDLGQWMSEVPSAVLSNSPILQLRLTLKLTIHFHGAMCLLHQPSQVIVKPSDEALEICYRHAAKRLQTYDALHESGNLVYSWRTVHDIFLAGTTVMYCVWISTSVRNNISLSMLVSACRRCSNLLTIGGEWWPVIRKSKSSLERLAHHTIGMFAENLGSYDLETDTSFDTSNHSGFERLPENLGSSPDWQPEHVEEALASAMSHGHGGELANIFNPSAGVFIPLGSSSVVYDSHPLGDEFWTDLGSTATNDPWK